MTCIIALQTDKELYIGGDLLASDFHTKGKMKSDKVFCVGDFIFGFCGSFRMHDLLRYSFSPPERSVNEDTMTYIVNAVIPTIKATFANGGYGTHPVDSDNVGGNFIMCYEGVVYEIQDDYSVLTWEDNILCVGSGSIACKAYATALYDNCFNNDEFYSNKKKKLSITPEEIIVKALHYTSENITSVGGIGTIYKQGISNE